MSEVYEKEVVESGVVKFNGGKVKLGLDRELSRYTIYVEGPMSNNLKRKPKPVSGLETFANFLMTGIIR